MPFAIADIDKFNLTFANLSSFVFCIFIVVFMGAILTSRNNSQTRFAFKKLIILSTACLIADMLSYVFDMRTFFGADVLNGLSKFASISLTVCVGCFWNLFFGVAFHMHEITYKKAVLHFIPAFMTSTVLFINVFTGVLFYIDANNVYHRGPLSFISFVLQYFPWCMLLFRSIFVKFNLKSLRYIKLRRTFIWVSTVLLIFGAMQILAQGSIAYLCFGITGSIFIMFLRFQDDQITNDLLTGLNNRYALDTYLVDKTKNYAEGIHGVEQLYLIMMDVNNFKRINDVYGHPEGDAALKTVSKILKQVGGNYDGLFISRFGGDEFAAVFETSSEVRVRELCDSIKDALRKETEDNKYRLSIGAGYALYTGRSMSLSMLYEFADKALYEDKDKMKNGEA